MADRIVEGTFKTAAGALEAVNRLINEEGYLTDELMLVYEDQAGFDDLAKKSPVQVDTANSEEDLSWSEKLKEALSFGTYNSDEAHSALEELGVTEELGEHFNEALEEGEIILLKNSDAPRSLNHLSEVNREVIE